VRTRTCLAILLVLVARYVMASPAGTPVLAEGTHCVAYRAQKTMLLLRTQEVVGRNCDISAQVLPEVGGLYHIEVNIPLRSFQSGETDRDKEVMKILLSDQRPELTFRSRALTAEGWRELFAKSEFELEGYLSIGNKTFPLKLAARYSERSESAEVEGLAQVRFSDFDLRPPKIVGGLLVKTKPELELHFHLLSQRILGADSIRPTPNKISK
jgi:polyisoprenoid-binding protein YceI